MANLKRALWGRLVACGRLVIGQMRGRLVACGRLAIGQMPIASSIPRWRIRGAPWAPPQVGNLPHIRICAICLPLLLALPAHADIQFHAKPMTGAKLLRGKAVCEIRLIVDRQVDVSLRGDAVSVHTLTGADARDNGSECSAPLPARAADGFAFAVKKQHGEVRLVAEPSVGNNFTAIVSIHSKTPGDGLYDLRIAWNIATEPVGINSNNAIHYAARGTGKATLNESAPAALGDASVDIDRGGNLVVAFRSGLSGTVSFTGTLMSWEGGVLKMDARADERFLHLPGSMYLYFDAAKQIYKIAIDATNGQDQLRVTWERK
jgi:hypothetical protein